MEQAATPSNWYVIHTKVGDEFRAAANLQLGGIETFTPRLARRGRPAYETLFPGYMFARFCLLRRLAHVRFTRGVKHVVSFGTAPVPVDDAVALIQQRLGPDGAVPAPEIRVGEAVRVVDGPFSSLVGVLERQTPRSQRVSILLSGVTCQARLVVDASLLDPAGS